MEYLKLENVIFFIDEEALKHSDSNYYKIKFTFNNSLVVIKNQSDILHDNLIGNVDNVINIEDNKFKIECHTWRGDKATYELTYESDSDELHISGYGKVVNKDDFINNNFYVRVNRLNVSKILSNFTK